MIAINKTITFLPREINGSWYVNDFLQLRKYGYHRKKNAAMHQTDINMDHEKSLLNVL